MDHTFASTSDDRAERSPQAATHTSPVGLTDADAQAQPSVGLVISTPRAGSPAAILRLQRRYGNQSVTRLLSAATTHSHISRSVIQRDFPDDANAARLKQARIQSGTQDMRLDHGVSQDTLKALAKTLSRIPSFVGKNTVYTQSRDAWQRLTAELDTDMGDADATNLLTSELLNLPQTITPGYSKTTNNPGETFDPQIAVTGAQADSTYESDELLNLDNAARKIERLGAFFPSESSERTYNTGLDAQLAEALGTIADSLKNIKGSPAPAFDASTFYGFDPHDYDAQVASNPQKVKKVGADWQSQKPAGLGNQAGHYLAYAPQQFNWQYTVANAEAVIGGQGRKREFKGNKADISVDVTVDIPNSCWQHIYDRHWIPTFAGDIRPINMFWKVDPYANIDQAMLEPEIQLLIERRLDILKLYRDNENTKIGINEPVTDLFFQGTMDVTPTGNDEVTVEFTVKSIAPQHKNLAFAVEPLMLR